MTESEREELVSLSRHILLSYFRRTFQTLIEQLEKLFQRCLIHHVDQGHFHDEKINDRTTRGNWTILLTGDVDLLTGLRCDLQFLFDISGRDLRCFQRSNQIVIIDKRTLETKD